MKIQIEKHLFYEIYPEVLADVLSHQSIEEQALFLSNFLASLDNERMNKIAEIFTQYSYGGIIISKDLEEFAKLVKDAMIVKFGGDYD